MFGLVKKSRGFFADAKDVIHVFFFRGFGMMLSFLFNALVARMLGAEDAGLYFLAMSVTAILSCFARLGLDGTLLRFVAFHAAKQEWGLVRGIFFIGMRSALVMSVVLTVLLFWLSPWLADVIFQKPKLGVSLRWMSFSVISFSLMMLLGESVKGLGLARHSVMISGVIAAMVSLLSVWPMVKLFGVRGANLSYFVGTAVASAIGFLWWRKAIAAKPAGFQLFPMEELRASAIPLYVMSILYGAVVAWMPLFLLGIWGSAHDSGIFGAASRLAVLLGFFLNAVSVVSIPRLSAHYAEGNLDMLGRMARKTALLVMVATLPIFMVFLFAADRVMSLFGTEYIQGGIVLLVLSIGQLVNCFVGPAGFLLVMSGNEKAVRDSSAFGAATLFLVAFLAIPACGMLGAAIAASAGMVVDRLLVAWFCWKKTGILGVAWPESFLPSRILVV